MSSLGEHLREQRPLEYYPGAANRRFLNIFEGFEGRMGGGSAAEAYPLSRVRKGVCLCRSTVSEPILPKVFEGPSRIHRWGRYKSTLDPSRKASEAILLIKDLLRGHFTEGF